MGVRRAIRPPSHPGAHPETALQVLEAVVGTGDRLWQKPKPESFIALLRVCGLSLCERPGLGGWGAVGPWDVLAFTLGR